MNIPEYWFSIEAGIDPIVDKLETMTVQTMLGQYDAEGKRLSDGWRIETIGDDNYAYSVVALPADPTPTTRVLRITEITFFNVDDVPRRIEFRRRLRDSLTAHPIAAATVPVGGRYTYTPETQWVLYNANGTEAT